MAKVYFIIDNERGDQFETRFEKKEEAVEEARWRWSQKSISEKKHYNEFCVIECEDLPEDEQYYDGELIWDAMSLDGEVDRELKELVDRINSSREWNPHDLEAFCDMAGLLDEYKAADGDTFESVVLEAAEALGVRIY